MATFKVKQPKPKKGEMEPPSSVDWPTTVCVPISKEMAAELKVGKEVEICLRGKINSLSTREGHTYDPGSKLELLLSEVEMETGGEDYEELADA